jgi:hypothetical protein
MAQQALDLRARAEQFRTFAESSRNPAQRQTLLDLARDSDDFAARIEAELPGLATAPPAPAADPSASKPT